MSTQQNFPTPIPKACELAAGSWPDGCDWCGKIIRPRRVRWCSDWCEHQWKVNHHWPVARKFTLRRDGHRCVKCNSGDEVEVNHIRPLRGMGYKPSCWHHLDNLESLCSQCHDAVTFVQQRVWST